MPDPCVLGVDLGGTAIKLGLFSLEGVLQAEHHADPATGHTGGCLHGDR